MVSKRLVKAIAYFYEYGLIDSSDNGANDIRQSAWYGGEKTHFRFQ
jgi:hypothetical protein